MNEGAPKGRDGGGVGVGVRVGQEGEWWEQMYGCGNTLRMGGSGRKDTVKR